MQYLKGRPPASGGSEGPADVSRKLNNCLVPPSLRWDFAGLRPMRSASRAAMSETSDEEAHTGVSSEEFLKL